MGGQVSAPPAPVDAALITHKSRDWYASGTATMPGHSPHFGDSFANVENEDGSRAAWVVATSHQAPISSQVAADTIAANLLGVLKGQDVTEGAIKRAFTDADATMKANPEFKESLAVDGVSVSAVVIEKNEDGTFTASVAGLGSQTAAIRTADGVQVSAGEHSLGDQSEMDRITAAGGEVKQAAPNPMAPGSPQPNLLDGKVAASRGIGYWDMKQASGLDPAAQKVSSSPTVRTVGGLGEGAFLMLGSEGMFKVNPPQAVGDWLEGLERARMGGKLVATDYAWMDVKADGKPLGRIKFGLYGKEMPKMVENFKALCTGEKGFGYKGSTFFSVAKGIFAMGGDITQNNGKGGRSIFANPDDPEDNPERALFDVESYKVLHNADYMVSMVPSGVRVAGGPPAVGSTFLLGGKAIESHDMVLPAFGKIVDGQDVLNKLTEVEVDEKTHAPTVDVVIEDCGIEPAPANAEDEQDTPDAETDTTEQFQPVQRAFQLMKYSYVRGMKASLTATLIRLGESGEANAGLVMVQGSPQQFKDNPDGMRRFKDFFALSVKRGAELGSDYAEGLGQLKPKMEEFSQLLDKAITAAEEKIKQEQLEAEEKRKQEEKDRVGKEKKVLEKRLQGLPQLHQELPGARPLARAPLHPNEVVFFGLLAALVLCALCFILRGIYRAAHPGGQSGNESGLADASGSSATFAVCAISAVFALHLRTARRRLAAADGGDSASTGVLELPLVAASS